VADFGRPSCLRSSSAFAPIGAGVFGNAVKSGAIYP
jgi:hypothetical protein